MAADRLRSRLTEGGHALTEERFDAIVDWVTAQRSKNESIGG